ncbi:MAG: hypothetical protein ACXABY_09185 [Candidatus Thorarchaeota archaeon]|jgi:hypothetical protein
MQLTVEDTAYINYLTGQFSHGRPVVPEEEHMALYELNDDEFVPYWENGVSEVESNLELQWAREQLDFISFQSSRRGDPDLCVLDNKELMTRAFKNWVKSQFGDNTAYVNFMIGKAGRKKLRDVIKENDLQVDMFCEKEPITDGSPSVTFQTGVESSRHDQYFTHGDEGGKKPFYDGADERDWRGYVIPYIRGTKILNINVVSGEVPKVPFKQIHKILEQEDLAEYWKRTVQWLKNNYLWAMRARSEEIKTIKNGLYWVYYRVYEVTAGARPDGSKIRKKVTLFSPMPISDLTDEARNQVRQQLEERKKVFENLFS